MYYPGCMGKVLNGLSREGFPIVMHLEGMGGGFLQLCRAYTAASL